MVLGSNSFTGSHFINYLINHTSEKVIGVSRQEEKNFLFLPYARTQDLHERFKFFQGDLRNTAGLADLLDKEKPETLVNFAGQTEVKTSWSRPQDWFETNTSAIVNLGNFLREKKYLQKFIAVSTPEVYGATDDQVPENETYRPSSPYAVSKLAGDLFLKALHEKEGFPVVFTRAANVYGPHQQLYRIIPKTILSLLKGEKITLNNAGRSRRAFLYVEDDAEGTLAAIQHGQAGEVYHLAPRGEIVSIRQVVEKICTTMGHDFESSTLIAPETPWRDALYSLNPEKAEKELGWRARISLEDGIDRTIHWIKDNFEELSRMPTEYKHFN